MANVFSNLNQRLQNNLARSNDATKAAIQSRQQNAGPSTAPAKAPAAPGKTNDVFTGLCEALNTFQRRLSDPKDPNRKYDVPDEYEIEFAPESLASSTLKRQGTTDKSKTPMQQQSPGALNSAQNSVNYKGSVVSVTAGMQIVQFIDQIMRSSSYITDQLLYIVDPETQEIKPNPNPPGGIIAWYKVSVQATQLAYDARRNDHAYRMKFLITPYAINELPSDWFKNARYRGSHKSYNYWFTGANTEILNFEQEYNNLYRLIISGLNVPVQQARTDFRKPDQYRRTYLPTSENHAKGADGYVNEGPDNAASFLYSPTDQARIKLRIVGDPAWMQQGEVAEGVSARNFNFNPFNADGTINYDSQEVVFDISWNQPADYDMNTGLIDPNKTNQAGTYRTQPQFNATYTAIKCKNIFSKGRFEQELEGRLLVEYDKNKTASDAGRPIAGNPGTQNGTRPGLTAEDINNGWVDQNGLLVQGTDVVAQSDENQEDSGPQLLNSPLPEPPTSDGDIVQYTPELNDNQALAGIIDNPDAQLTNRET